MKVKAIKDYYDLELEKAVKVGQELEMSEERAQKLSSKKNKAGMVLVELMGKKEPEEPEAEVEEPEDKKPQAKKKAGKGKRTEIKEVAPVQQESEEEPEEPEAEVK